MSTKPGESHPQLPFEDPKPDAPLRGEALVTDGVSTAHSYAADPKAFGADWPSAVYNRRFRDEQAAAAGQPAVPSTEVLSNDEATRAAMEEAVRAAHEGAERARQQFGSDVTAVQPSGTYLAARALRGQVVDSRRRAARRSER